MVYQSHTVKFFETAKSSSLQRSLSSATTVKTQLNLPLTYNYLQKPSYIIKSLKPKLVLILFKHSVRTAKKTLHFTITKINWLTLFKEIISVYTYNHMKPINRLCGYNAGLLIVKAGGTYSYH
jgi:hypothetical protein